VRSTGQKPGFSPHYDGLITTCSSAMPTSEDCRYHLHRLQQSNDCSAALGSLLGLLHIKVLSRNCWC